MEQKRRNRWHPILETYAVGIDIETEGQLYVGVIGLSLQFFLSILGKM